MLRSIALLGLTLLLAGCGGVPPSGPPGTPLTAGGTPGPAAASPSITAPGTPAAEPEPTPAPLPSSAPSAAPEPTAATPRAEARWVRAGRFATDREDTKLARLAGGDVLAAGSEPTCGIESAGSDSAERWDAARSRWRVTDRLPSLRAMTTLIGLADGRAMVVGGANPSYVAKSSTAVYDPARGRWGESGLLATARMSFAAAALEDGGALVAGGLLIDDRQRGRALRSAETWDPDTREWTVIAPLSSVRVGAVGVTLADGRVLVVGGFPSWGARRPLASAEVYDPATGRWRAAGTLAAVRDGFSLVALRDGGALVVGGDDGETAAEVFDAATRTWSRVPGRAPTGVQPAAVALEDGRVLVVSGAVTRLYDPAAGRWRRGPDLPRPMWNASAVLLEDGSALVAGGWTDPAAPDETPGCPGYDNRGWRFLPGG